MIAEDKIWRGHITIAKNVKDDRINRAAVNSVNLGKGGKPFLGSAFPLYEIELRWFKGAEEGNEIRLGIQSSEWFNKTFKGHVPDGRICAWSI